MDPQQIHAVFGERLSNQIFAENEKDSAAGITGERIRASLDVIRQEIGKIPDAEVLEQRYARLGAKSTLEDIGVPEQLGQALLDVSPMVRNRLSLMRLRRCLVQS